MFHCSGFIFINIAYSIWVQKGWEIGVQKVLNRLNGISVQSTTVM
jgi:hypothetical protein